MSIRFGDYVMIEQMRHGHDNELYQHKVIGTLKSNAYVDVPVSGVAEEVLHSKMEKVVLCITCGVSEIKALKYRVKDVRRFYKKDSISGELHQLRTENRELAAENEKLRQLLKKHGVDPYDK